MGELLTEAGPYLLSEAAINTPYGSLMCCEWLEFLYLDAHGY